jgi:hypothetical protein
MHSATRLRTPLSAASGFLPSRLKLGNSAQRPTYSGGEEPLVHIVGFLLLWRGTLRLWKQRRLWFNVGGIGMKEIKTIEVFSDYI